MKHQFNVGQIVELKPSVTRFAVAGQYEITLLMPEPDVSSVSPRYRIKSCDEIYQRIVPESDLTLSTGPMAEAVVDYVVTGLMAAPSITSPQIED